MSDIKPTYAALPLRALGDDQLSRADLVTLGAVAAHDRFSRNRTGCFASYGRLAEMSGQCERALKRSIVRLQALGYLRVEASPMDRRRRVLFVEYTDADAAAMRGSGRSFVKRSGLRLAPAPEEFGVSGDTESRNRAADAGRGAQSEIGVNGDTDNRAIGVSSFQKAEQIQRVESCNIFCETDKRSREARLGEVENWGGEPDPATALNDPGGGERREPSASAVAAGVDAAFWRGVETELSPREQVATLRRAAAGVRASPALLATDLSRRARGFA